MIISSNPYNNDIICCSEEYRAQESEALQRVADLRESLGREATDELLNNIICPGIAKPNIVQKIHYLTTNLWETLLPLPEADTFLPKILKDHEIELVKNGCFFPIDRYKELTDWIGEQNHKYPNLCKIIATLSLKSFNDLKAVLERKEELNLNNLGLTEVPNELFAYGTRLKKLNLNHNSLTHLKGIEQLHNLVDLRINNNELEAWPMEVARLKNMKTLLMANNKFQTSLPREFISIGLDTIDY